MTLAPGRRLGPYEITAPLGAGGMGEVYKASDTRLGRTVAIKVLPDHLAKSEDRRRRFTLEAKAISTLNHPHICVLHDVGHEDGVDYLVMECLEGETLAARLRRGPLSWPDALRLGAEMADAVGRAHQAGIVHRDLKPGNVMITPAGAKLMDFGLAKLREPDGQAAEPASQLATETRDGPITDRGTVIGTVGYMAPEQLEGRGADARADVFALGLILYEMVTGQRAFPGDSQASLIASILTTEPPSVSSLRPGCPPAIDRLLTACLAKDPERRWQSAHDLATEIRWVAEGGEDPRGAAAGHAPRRRWERLAWAAAVALLLGALGLVVTRRPAPASTKAVRFALPFPPGWTPAPVGQPVISAGGDAIAVMGVLESRFHLLVHTLDSQGLVKVPDSEDASDPFWSPDGRELVFAVRTELRRFDVARGSVQRLTTLEGPSSGGTWNAAGDILVSANGQLVTVPRGGGAPKVLEVGEPKARLQPQFLPDGRHYLFSAAAGAAGARAVYVGSLDGGGARLLVDNAYEPGYAAASRHLFFVRANVLMAQPFDPGRLEPSGQAMPASEQVVLVPRPATAARGATAAAYAVSANNTLVWQTSGLENLQLTWFDRSGRRLDAVGEPGDYSAPALSPDEKSLAISRRDPRTRTRDIWIYDLVRNTSRRLTFDDTDETGAAWSPDGAFVAYSSTVGGARDIRRRRADGSGVEDVLVPNATVAGGHFVEDWSPDGTLLLHNSWRAGLQPDLLLVRMPPDPGAAPTVFAGTGFAEQMGTFSPDGRWIAYSTNESGRNEVYVSAVPREGAASSRKTLISTSGGIEPRWRKDGKELFYVQGSSVMAVDVAIRGPEIEVGRPRRLFDVTLPEPRRNRFVVSRDGQRFLVNLSLSPLNVPVEVMLNWRPAR